MAAALLNLAERTEPDISAHPLVLFFFFFNDPATTEIYTLSLHDALPIRRGGLRSANFFASELFCNRALGRSEEHTSELQSPMYLVCRLLLEKKNAPSDKQSRRTCPTRSRPETRAGWPGGPDGCGAVQHDT